MPVPRRWAMRGNVLVGRRPSRGFEIFTVLMLFSLGACGTSEPPTGEPAPEQAVAEVSEAPKEEAAVPALVETPQPSQEEPEEPQAAAEGSYLKDTQWAAGKEGLLVLGLDGGLYEPYQSSVVEFVQRTLADVGDYTGPVTGVLDRATMEALQTFQQREGLAPSGVPTPRTREALRRARSPLEGGPT